jgi:hypothetical protein
MVLIPSRAIELDASFGLTESNFDAFTLGQMPFSAMELDASLGLTPLCAKIVLDDAGSKLLLIPS